MKYFSLIILLLSNSATQAQSANSFESTPYFSSLIVESMQESQTWYSDVFDLTEESRFESEERGINQVNLSGKGKWFELIELNHAIKPEEAIDGYTARTRMIGFFKIGFQVADFDETMSFLEDLEVDFYGDVVKDPNTDKRIIIIKDPDGNRVQFFER